MVPSVDKFRFFGLECLGCESSLIWIFWWRGGTEFWVSVLSSVEGVVWYWLEVVREDARRWVLFLLSRRGKGAVKARLVTSSVNCSLNWKLCQYFLCFCLYLYKNQTARCDYASVCYKKNEIWRENLNDLSIDFLLQGMFTFCIFLWKNLNLTFRLEILESGKQIFFLFFSRFFILLSESWVKSFLFAKIWLYAPYSHIIFIE